MANVTVRRLGAGDVDHVNQVVATWWHRPVDNEAAAALLADPRVIAVGAFDTDRMVGFGYGHLSARPDGPDMANLYSLDVLPGHRRRGIGAAIVTEFRRCAGPVAKTWVLTDSDNDPANALYRSLDGVPYTATSRTYSWPGTPSSGGR